MSPVKRASAVAGLRRAVGPAPQPAGEPVPMARTPAKTKPVRITVDLSPEDYRRLTGWLGTTAAALNLPKVSAAEAIRAMIRLTDLDKGISAEVTQMICQEREQ